MIEIKSVNVDGFEDVTYGNYGKLLVSLPQFPQVLLTAALVAAGVVGCGRSKHIEKVEAHGLACDLGFVLFSGIERRENFCGFLRRLGFGFFCLD